MTQDIYAKHQQNRKRAEYEGALRKKDRRAKKSARHAWYERTYETNKVNNDKFRANYDLIDWTKKEDKADERITETD